MSQINNFQDHLNSALCPQLVYTGTFDPIHNGHLSVIEAAVAEVKSQLIINPCNRNPDKTQTRSDLSLRIYWLNLALKEHSLQNKALILDDPKFRTGFDSLDKFMQNYYGKVFKIVGPDKKVPESISSRVLGSDREPALSSSSLKITLNNGEFTEAKSKMPKGVVDDIKNRAFTFKTTTSPSV